MDLRLRLLAGFYGIAKLPPKTDLPAWASGADFWAHELASIVSASDETTIICPQEQIPDTVTATRGWACLRTLGPFPFEAAGVVRDLITPISDAGIGVFVVCTYDGEHLLVPATDLPRVRKLLTKAGHSFDM